MEEIQLIAGTSPIFKQKSQEISTVDDKIRELMDNMLEVLHIEKGIGMAATMIGVLKRVVVIDYKEDDGEHKLFMANPEILRTSDEVQTFNEASLCFPGVDANITRPKIIKVKYIDRDNQAQELEATGFLSSVIQHEIDYLNGVVYLDYLSNLKKNTLIRKMNKYIKKYNAHKCGASCSH